MLKRFLFLISVSLLAGCESDVPVRNPYLPAASFDLQIDLNLPLYSPLANTGNSVTLPSNLGGIKGVHLTNVGFGTFRAFEVSCPNHPPSGCSATLLEGSQVTCQCSDNLDYSVFTGQLLNRQGSETLFDLKEYQVRTEGSVIYVFN
jgi:nitrite reductase/ring-hydroxylating ferredoxin subunit